MNFLFFFSSDQNCVCVFFASRTSSFLSFGTCVYFSFLAYFLLDFYSFGPLFYRDSLQRAWCSPVYYLNFDSAGLISHLKSSSKTKKEPEIFFSKALIFSANSRQSHSHRPRHIWTHNSILSKCFPTDSSLPLWLQLPWLLLPATSSMMSTTSTQT